MKVTYTAWLMWMNQEGYKIYLIKEGSDISDYYSKKYDHIRSQKEDVVIIFGKGIEPPDFISWEYENDSECYK